MKKPLCTVLSTLLYVATIILCENHSGSNFLLYRTGWHMDIMITNFETVGHFESNSCKAYIRFFKTPFYSFKIIWVTKIESFIMNLTMIWSNQTVCNLLVSVRFILVWELYVPILVHYIFIPQKIVWKL